jgi:hypothetical protein
MVKKGLEIVLNQSWKSEKMVEATHFYGILAVFRGIPYRSVPFRASELALPRNSECIGMSTFFRGITEYVPSLLRGIFSEGNSVPNPMCRRILAGK